MHFVVVDADENHSIVPQQVAGEKQARVHHAEPPGMESPAGLGVGALPDALLAHLPRIAQVVVQPLAVVVGVDELVAGVVRRVDVDHLDLAVVGLLQQFQHFEVVALDDEIPGAVPTHAFAGHGQQSTDGGLLHVAESFGLSRPIESVTLDARLDMLAQRGFELVGVDPALAENLRRGFAQLRQQIVGGVECGEGKPVFVSHGCLLSCLYLRPRQAGRPSFFSSANSALQAKRERW